MPILFLVDPKYALSTNNHVHFEVAFLHSLSDKNLMKDAYLYPIQVSCATSGPGSCLLRISDKPTEIRRAPEALKED